MNNIVQYVKKKLKEHDSTISVTESSPLIDLQVSPLSTILAPYEEDHEQKMREMTMEDENAISESAMDKFSANFYVDRTVGSKATGNVYVYYQSPRTEIFTTDITFETEDGKKYHPTRTFSITEEQMRQNIERYPLYSTGSIPITAESYGSSGETNPGTIKIVKGLKTGYILVDNPVSITGGTTRDTNTQLKSKILTTGINESISSSDGIRASLMRNFPTLTDVVVKGVGDEEMTRDVAYTVSGSSENLNMLPTTFSTSDFFGAVSGYIDPPANRSIGYWSLLSILVPTGSGLVATDLPDPSSWSIEWSDAWYRSVWKNNDAYYQTVGIEHLLNESFAGASTSVIWSYSDSNTDSGELKHPNEIEVLDGEVRLGRQVRSSTGAIIKADEPIIITLGDANQIMSMVTQIAGLPPVNSTVT